MQIDTLLLIFQIICGLGAIHFFFLAIKSLNNIKGEDNAKSD
jgi:hypothetical protein